MLGPSEAILLVAVLLTVAVVVWLWSRRNWSRLSDSLKERFGPEYDRALEQHRDRDAAEQDLLEREKRLRKVAINPLTTIDHDRFLSSWVETQKQFVDDPVSAVHRADHLIADVMTARGYPLADFDQRVADVSVDHGRVVQHYRAAHVLARQSEQGQASTEDLRQAFVHYRVLFADLLETAPAEAEAPRPGGFFRRKEAHT